MSDNSDKDEKLSPRLEYFAERLNLLFSYFFCVLEFEHDEDFLSETKKNDRAWALKTIQNACLHTTLIALRDLDDFFTPQSKLDDIKASDFGFNKDFSFLAKSERKAINKRIAHTTLQGIQERLIPWDIFELVTKGVSQSLEFLKWIEKSYPALRYFLIYTAALTCRTKTQAIFNYVASEVAKRRKGKVKSSARPH